MKYKKYSYILVLILMLLVGINGVNAEEKTCYYMTADKNTSLEYNVNTQKFTIIKRAGNEIKKNNTEPLINASADKKDWTLTQIVVPKVAGCPNYVVYRHDDYQALGLGNDGIFGFNSLIEAQQFAEKSEGAFKLYKQHVYLLSSKNANGSGFTEEEAYSKSDTQGCDYLFGDKDDPDSIRYLLNEILLYPKILVPILVIVLGMLDLAKAVMSSREDNMKKAQATFIKRIFIGIVIFFVPTILDLLMFFTELALGYGSCGI